MTETLNQGLLITAIGMGLVFLALILLWGLMALMAKIPAGKQAEEEPVEEAAAAVVAEAAAPAADLRRKAAAIAVAVALGLQQTSVSLAPKSPHAVSSWLVTRRSGQFNQNALISNRKSRGSTR